MKKVFIVLRANRWEPITDPVFSVHDNLNDAESVAAHYSSLPENSDYDFYFYVQPIEMRVI